MLALSQTKLKGNGEVSWCVVSMQVFKRWKELEKVWLFENNEWHSAVTEFGCVNARTVWVKFKFSLGKVCEG